MPYEFRSATVPDDNGGNARSVPYDEQEFLAKARDRFKLAAEAETKLRELMLDDLRFYNGCQWPDQIRKQREADDRPCLTINRLPQFVHSISNEIRQNKPAPKVSPVDDNADAETAEVYQGIIRYIERQSNATVVRSYASFYSIVTGRGYYRLVTEYADKESQSGDQDIYIRRIKNPLTVYMDPSCREPDYSDAKYGFIIEDLTEEQFKELYPDAEISSAEEYRSTGDGQPPWRWKGGVRTAEYFCCDYEDVQLFKVAGGGEEVTFERLLPGMQVIAQRTERRHFVLWSKIDDSHVLEQSKWPGQHIPIIPVLGEEYDVDGETQLTGIVRAAKDPQRMLNYWESAKTETIALAPKVPYIAAEGQLENHEGEWAASNRKNFAVLQYKPKSVDGALISPPQRQVFEPPIQAISLAEGGAVDNLKAVTGVYDPSLGAMSNEVSGIAIRQRLKQGSTSNYHYIDNVATAIRWECVQLLDLIPKIYDRPGRVLRILGEDGTENEVTLNQLYQDRSGIQRWYQLDAGKYDVAIDVGPTYQTKRQESVDSMTAFAQAAPQLVPQYADLYVKAMDWPGAREIAERVRPPGIPSDDQPQIPPQAAMQIQQLGQENQQLKAMLEQAQQIIQGKQVEMASKERTSAAQDSTKREIALLQAQVDLLLKKMDTGTKLEQQDGDVAHQQAMQAAAIRSSEDIAAANIQSKEDIAELNASVKITADQMAAETARQQAKRPIASFDSD